MTKTRYAVAVAVLSSAVALAQGNVPDRITFNGRLTDTAGQPVTGTHALVFNLFDVASGGTALWSETYASTSFTADGLAFVELGTNTPLTSTILDGRKMYLEISVDGTAMSPRVGVVSVPYAIRATTAAEAGRLGTLTPTDVQRRVTGTCSAGNAIRTVNADGTVVCEATGGGGSGDIFSVNTSGTSGLAGGAATGDVNLTLTNCPVGNVLKSTGTNAWGCATDTDTNTTYTAGAGGGLTLTGTAFTLGNCAVGQVLKSTGVNTWSCQADNGQTYSGADFIVNGTAVQAASFNVNGTAQIGTSQTVPTARLNVQAAATVTGTGAVAGSAGGTTANGIGTLFTTEATVGDIITASGQQRTITAISAASGTNAISVDSAWTADLLGVAYTLRRSAFTVRTNGGTIVARVDANGGATFSSLQRRIARTQGYLNDTMDNGNLINRTVTLNKVSTGSGVRVAWNDNFRVYNNNNACRWELWFNGSACANPGPIVFDKYEGNTASNRHDPASVFGTCFANAAGALQIGNVTVQARVYPVPGYVGPDCYTGWNGQLFSLEAEEVY